MGQALPIAATLATWWLGTALVLWLCRLPASSHRWSLPLAGLAAVGALHGLGVAAELRGPIGAYLGFGCAVLLWGCIEMSYYTGWLTGPRKVPCPPGCGDWRRFVLAVQTSLHHELAVISGGVLVVLTTAGGADATGMWTYLVLWWMRWSAKLNLFLGVPNQYESFLPPRLRFLMSYMSRRRMNLLFPVSVCVPTLVAGALLNEAALPGATAQENAGALLLSALLLLAVLEHWFLVLPLPEYLIWKWALPRGAGAAREARP